MRSITDIMNAWYGSSDEVVRFGRDLLHGEMFDDFDPTYDSRGVAHNLLAFFEKPHRWNAEHAWWVANEWPDDPKAWERGRDTNWKVA